MKHFFVLLLLAAFPSLFAQSEAETLKAAKALVETKKYESAFRVLDKFDRDNKNPEIVLMKQDILLNYFVTSMMHQMFALKDLEKDEEIMDYRGKEGSFSMHTFPANEILDTLIAANPGNCRLYKALGDYYYDCYLRYGGRWLQPDVEVLALAHSNYTKAIEGKCGDYMSHYVLGYLDLMNEKYAECIPHFLESIKMDKNYPSSHYNLAYAFLYTDDRQNAIKYASNARELYKDPGYKGDAARMVAQAYNELKDVPNTIANYELSDSIDPNNYYTLKPLLAAYVSSNNTKAAAMLETFYNLAPENPTIYSDLEAIYIGKGRDGELIAFYNGKLKEVKDNSKISGNLHFFLASLYIHTDKPKAKEHFLKAKEQFSTLFEPDHEVFGIIEEGLNSIDEK